MFNRTMQSGYSELLGLFPPLNSTTDTLSDDQIQALAQGGEAAPPFTVSESVESTVSASLGSLGLPHGYT